MVLTLTKFIERDRKYILIKIWFLINAAATFIKILEYIMSLKWIVKKRSKLF